jgi:4-hydroxy-4-methyl-2-oxoglutarate aldolase
MRVYAPAFPVGIPGGDNLGLHRAVYAAAPGEVLVVDTGGNLEFGYWGEILAEAAIARGLAGLVIDGGVRDVQQLRELPFPVFAANVCIRGTVKDASAHNTIGDPVRVGDVQIRRGDIIIGDADGVVAVPVGEVDAVLRAVHEREAKERSIIERIRAGESTLDIYGLA